VDNRILCRSSSRRNNAAVICKCRCNKTEPEIEKTYKIIAELNRETELTVEEIYYKLANIIDIPFELKIRHGTLTHCQEYVLRMDDPHAYMSDIFISDSEHNKNRKLASIEGRIYDISLRGVLSIPGGEIVPSPYLAELMTIKTERIDTLEITSEQQEDTEFLNKLIILEKKQVT